MHHPSTIVHTRGRVRYRWNRLSALQSANRESAVVPARSLFAELKALLRKAATMRPGRPAPDSG